MRKPNTFILFWNPLISNVQDEDRPEFIEALHRGCEYQASWSIFIIHFSILTQSLTIIVVPCYRPINWTYAFRISTGTAVIADAYWMSRALPSWRNFGKSMWTISSMTLILEAICMWSAGKNLISI